LSTRPASSRRTQRVELLQREDRRVEHLVATLPVDVLLRVAGQRRDDLDALVREKIGQILEARLVEDRQIAAVDHADARAARAADEMPEMRVQLRRAAGDVDGAHPRCRQHGENLVDRLPGHHLAAVGTRIDVAVQAGLVASVAEVDLQRLERASRHGRKVGVLEQGQRGVHVRSTACV
jgi:hypothetical protein